jgi:hypothetical protein
MISLNYVTTNRWRFVVLENSFEVSSFVVKISAINNDRRMGGRTLYVGSTQKNPRQKTVGTPILSGKKMSQFGPTALSRVLNGVEHPFYFIYPWH